MSTKTEGKAVETGPGRAALAHRIALAAGLLAALSAWASGELSGVYRFEVPAHLIGKIGAASSEQARLKAAAEDRGATFAYAALGLALGLSLGGAAGLARGSVSSAVQGALLGGALGAGTGCGMAMALLPLFHQYMPQITDSVLIPLLLHGGLWAPLGAAAGLAYGWGRFGPRGLLRPILGGLAGAVLGVCLFEVVGVLALTMSGTTQAIPATPTTRLLAMLALALPAAAGASSAEPRERLAHAPENRAEPLAP